MISGLQNLISSVLAPVTTTPKVTLAKSDNPFANPFMQSSLNDSYAKNEPVSGGFFAGYYNNKPNIVGRKLFLEV